MARYKYIDTSPRFIPIDLARQLLAGTFEHAVNTMPTARRAADLVPVDRSLWRNAASICSVLGCRGPLFSGQR